MIDGTVTIARRQQAMKRLGRREPKLGDIVRLSEMRVGVITKVGDNEVTIFMSTGRPDDSTPPNRSQQVYKLAQLYEDGWTFG